jgi:hypothetical protein
MAMISKGSDGGVRIMQEFKTHNRGEERINLSIRLPG